MGTSVGAHGKNYSFHHAADEHINQSQYRLHNHYGAYEIFIFLEGNADFIVEGAIYPLKKYDTVLLNPNEFHNIRHHSGAKYERFVLHLQNSFFIDNNCDRFRRMLDARKPGTQNLIPAEFIIERKVPDILSRMGDYAADSDCTLLLPGVIAELLCALNKYPLGTTLAENNEKITPIIMYINENLSSALSIDTIAKKFFINKYHLCRIFKRHTGMTINKYITHKRIVLVKNLCRDGKTLSNACLEAGFGSYSNFYRMYVRETGSAPRRDIKRSADTALP